MTARSLPATPWPPLAAAAAALAILIAAPLAGLAAARVYALASGLGTQGVVIQGNIDRLLMTYEAIYVALLNLAIVVLTLLAARGFGGRPADVLALAPPANGPRAYAFGLATSALAAAIWFVSLLALAPDAALADFRPYAELMGRERSWLMPPILCLLAPLAEELLFRGFLFPSLSKSRLGTIGGALASSAAWTALHVHRTELALAQLFFAGLFLCWLLAHTGSLRVPLLCHVVFNVGVSIMVIGFGIPD